MSYITWHKHLELGIEAVDVEHQRLLSTINALYDEMLKGMSKEVMTKTLVELLKYTDYHFATEENLFRKYNVPNAKSHILQHNEYQNKITQFYDDFKTGKTVLSMEILEFLTFWWTNHIQQVDKLYVDFIKNSSLS